MHIDAKFVSTNMYHVGVITNYVTMLAWSVSTSNETQDYGYVASCPLLHVSKDAGAPRRWVLGRRVGCLSRDAKLLAPKPKTNLHLQRQNEGQQKHGTTV